MFLSPGSRARSHHISLSTVGQGYITANANINVWVSPTGNNANSGLSSLAPVLTPARGLTVAAQYDYQGLYYPTVNLSSGIYSVQQPVSLPFLKNVQGPNGAVGGILTGPTAGPDSLVTILDANVLGAVVANGGQVAWTLTRLTVDSDLCGLFAQGGAIIATPFHGSVSFANSVGGNGGCVYATDGGRIFLDASVITIASTQLTFIRAQNVAFEGQVPGHVLVTNSTFNLPSQDFGSGGNFFDVYPFGGDFTWWTNVVTNSSHYLGQQVNAGGQNITNFFTDDGTFSNIPGTGLGSVDNSIVMQALNENWVNFRTNFTGSTGYPSTSDVRNRQFALFEIAESAGGSTAYAFLHVAGSTGGAGVTPIQNFNMRKSFTSNQSLDFSYAGWYLDNKGAVAEVDFSLPAPLPGMRFNFASLSTQTVKVRSNDTTGSFINTSTAQSIGGGYVSITQAVSSMSACLEIDAVSTSQWVVRAMTGAWVVSTGSTV